MADRPLRNPPHFTIFKSAAEEAAESVSRGTWENEGGASAGPPDGQSRSAPPQQELDRAIEELGLALYSEDVRLGIVRDRDILDTSGALSALGGTRYHYRAREILASLAGVSDRQVLQACAAEPAGAPRGAAARVELRLRGVSDPDDRVAPYKSWLEVMARTSRSPAELAFIAPSQLRSA